MPKKNAKAGLPPLSEPPPIPDRLQEAAAREYWQRITTELVKAQTITSAHLEALESICRVWAEYCEMAQWCDDNDTVVITEKGYPIEDPRVRIRNNALATLMKLWPKFGLTPKGAVEINRGGSPAAITTTSPVKAFARKKTANPKLKKVKKK